MDLRNNLLIKKSDIEKALGVTIKKKAVVQGDLEPYLPRKTLNFYECIALFQGISPANYVSSNDINFHPMLHTLEEKILDGELANSEVHAFDEFNGIFEASIDRKSAEIFALKYGYEWPLPSLQSVECAERKDKSFSNQRHQDETRIVELEKQNLCLEAENIKLEENLRETLARLRQFEQIAEKARELKQSEKAQIEQLQQNKNQLNQTIANQDSRISQAKRDLFSLLVMKCYPDFQSRNSLFEAINADLKEKGIRQADIQYPTFDRLIDERLRINNNSPFPPKQK
ncbi:hypothetical protein N8E87_12255 [Avibacterium paragallinarum]|uniref:hypothetical protein n=1 Tax=Avibacterium paragallinarum TaxID=728 RepID=UPI0021F78C7D|nr:hypothetical protein [Avibacterium paragallinarum]UXN36904.1 hypothetical protein N8E87_12255 [Avibacterium paragallinarum]